MVKHVLTIDPATAHVVEHQMRNWELGRQQRTDRPQTGPQVQPFVALSRAVGAGGSEVAAQLGARLGWPVFDRQLLQLMAGNDDLRRRVYEQMDERDRSWFDAAVEAIFQGSSMRDDYFALLTSTVLALARQSRAVFLGRATDLILPRKYGLRVRIVASRGRRIAAFAARLNLPSKEAEAQMNQIEHERADWIQHHFRVDAAEQTRHDVIVNMDHFTVDQAVDLITHAMRIRGVVDSKATRGSV